MYIVHPATGDERLANILARFGTVVEKAGGEVVHNAMWARRRLEYPIRKMRDGIYVIMLYRAPQEVPAELERLFNISDEVMRFITIAHDFKEAQEKNFIADLRTSMYSAAPAAPVAAPAAAPAAPVAAAPVAEVEAPAAPAEAEAPAPAAEAPAAQSEPEQA